MKNPDRDKVSHLDALPNIGKAISADLHLIGIDHPKKLIGMDTFKMYEDLCTATGKRYDPCVIDVFMSAVHFMEGGKHHKPQRLSTTDTFDLRSFKS